MSRSRLSRFQQRSNFFIGIDSDGCAFDTMEIKHKECFIPNTIRHLGLQAVSKYAREAAEFVNLYSKWRGINRFPALIMALDLLRHRPEVLARNVEIPELPALRQWLEHEPAPANPALEAAVQGVNGAGATELRRVLAWSQAVNKSIDEMVHGVPPFPGVRATLQKARHQADLLVVSATPTAALEKEWAEHDLTAYVSLIAGQEMGKKADHLRLAAGGRYPAEHILMVGDAPGDQAAAQSVGALFYPITPGAEAESWERLEQEGLAHFLNGTYAGPYQDQLIAAFHARLPDKPPWQC